MAEKRVFYDESTGSFIVRPVSSSRITEAFLVSDNEGITELELSAEMSSGQDLDVFVNGRDQIEGEEEDFVRDLGENKLLFNYTVPKNAKIKVHLYV